MLENYVLKYDQNIWRYKTIDGLHYGNQVAEVLKVIRKDKVIYKNYLSNEAIAAGRNLVNVIKDLWPDVVNDIVSVIRAEIPLEQPMAAVWWYSVCIEVLKDKALFKEFVSYVRENRQSFSANTQYYLYYQIKSRYFRFESLDDLDTKEDIWSFFKEVVGEFADRVSVPLEIIPEKNRNPKQVLVIIEQFLGVQHAPTKIALDRSKVLIEKMGKEVLLINTAECLSQVGAIPFYDSVFANYADFKKMEKYQLWKGAAIPYFQCGENMPDISELEGILEEIRKNPPGYVVSIGGSSILANLVNKMIPVLTVGLGPADLECTTMKYQTLSRKLTEYDNQMLQRLGYDTNHVIESIFTSSLLEQTETVTRMELGIPEKDFVLVVAGGRLHDEVTREFLEMLEKVICPGIFVVFIGNFMNYESALSAYPSLKKQAIHLKFCNDILARFEVCDLYVNPVRKGGGTSGVGALFKSVPVVTVNYGDVAANVGEEFCVDNYAQMQEKILKYYEDKEYYRYMQEKGNERVKILLDSEKEFVRIMGEVEKREREF